MYSLELARATADELLREARKARGRGAVPVVDRSRFHAVRRLTG